MTQDLLSVAWNNSFHKIFNACWRESVKPLQFFSLCLPVSFLIHQRRFMYWKNVSSNNILLPAKLCALQTFPGQSLSQTDVSRTSYTKEFSCTYVCRYQLYMPSYTTCRYTERLLMCACRPAVNIRGLFGKACSPTMGKA